MGFWKKLRKKSKKSAENDNIPTTSTTSNSTPVKSKQTTSTNPSPGRNVSTTKSSPLKRLFSRKKELKLKSTQVKDGMKRNGGTATDAAIPNYYANHTDGYEIILEGQKVEYLSSPTSFHDENNAVQKQGTFSQMCTNFTCTDNGCSPLSDFPTFLTLMLSPNMDGIKNFVFGDDMKKKSIEKGTDGEITKSPREELNTDLSEMINPSASGSSLPFDEINSQSASGSLQSNEEEEEDDDDYNNNNNDDDTDTTPTLQEKKTFSAQKTDENKSPKGMINPKQSFSPKALEKYKFLQADGLGLSEEERYDSNFTLRFLREISNIGIMVTYYKVNSKGISSNDMLNLTIKPGLARGSRLLEPRLCWSKFGSDASSQSASATSMNSNESSISLLEIHSILTSLDPSNFNDDSTNFFTITTEDGEVYSFESPTIEDRNYVAHGLKNTVSWLSYHLVMGNMAMGTQLVSELDEEQGIQSGELPSLKTANKAMNELTYSFLS